MPLDLKTLELLSVLRELVENEDGADILENVYGIRRKDDAPLDRAIFAWADAGTPDVPLEPSGDPPSDPDANTIFIGIDYGDPLGDRQALVVLDADFRFFREIESVTRKGGSS